MLGNQFKLGLKEKFLNIKAKIDEDTVSSRKNSPAQNDRSRSRNRRKKRSTSKLRYKEPK